MHTPYIVLKNLTPDQVDRWGIQFAHDGRNIAEGMWRRSHDEYTHHTYGTNIDDKRRRLIHFIDKYEIIGTDLQKDLAITQSYLYICSTLPADDVQQYWQKHHSLATRHAWSIKEWSPTTFHIHKGDYEITGRIYDVHPNDIKHGTHFPENYATVEVTVRSLNEAIPKSKRETPWGVWQNKYRRPIPRKDPHIINDLREIEQYFPVHVELGCGPSLEAGIPPLSRLHHIYSAADYSSGTFLFGDDDTLLERIITDLAAFYASAAEPYKQCFLAEITPFYAMLGELRRRGLVLDPLINNNFDGLAKLVGFTEQYIRRYETTNWIPEIRFDPRAKALLVVGSHADRRLVRLHARQAGLQVIYVDPEGYYAQDGSFTEYPLEALDTSDILIRLTANDFGQKMMQLIEGSTSNEHSFLVPPKS